MAMRRCAGGMSVTSTPSMKHWPAVISSSPAIILQQRRLAAAGRAEQRGERAFVDLEAEIGDRCDRAVALRDLSQFDMGPAALRSRSSRRPRSSLDSGRQRDRLRHAALEDAGRRRHRQAGQHGDREIARIGDAERVLHRRMPTVRSSSSRSARRGTARGKSSRRR